MDERIRGYQALAAAVIGLTVQDITKGPCIRRKAAIAAVREGSLDLWLDLLSERYDIYESLTARLRKLTREGA